MKTEVYSWRVSADLKTELEQEAHRRKISLSALLDLIARDCLQAGGPRDSDDEQERLREAANQCIGTFASGRLDRSETASESVKERLRRRHGR